MEDLDSALNGPRKFLLLGGGNPGRIPEVEAIFRQVVEEIQNTPEELEKTLGIYDSPNGDRVFIEDLSRLLTKKFGREVKPANIALTNGSQNSFFFLFNLLAGEFRDHKNRKILLPLTPEYIGYSDVGLSADFFTSFQPTIEIQGEHSFKYRVDFDNLQVGEDIGAICVSRPTNPTGNMLTDEEIERLLALAKSHSIPLIIDSAYGLPFPGIVFREARDFWDEDIILTMSLSKLGLPGVRTGIVVAREEIIQAIACLNAVVNLAVGSVGPAIARHLVRDGRILDISQELVGPFYREKGERARAAFMAAMDPGIDYYIHALEGAIFLWIWFKDLPITAQELYTRLKERGVIVVPGHYYFPGLSEDWKHTNECIRVSYAQSEADVLEGLKIIAEEAGRAYA